jgi:hypothetical protein
MTPIESIFEIKSAVSALARYTSSRDAVVLKKVQVQYLRLIDRFFRENQNYIKPEQREACLRDQNYFMNLMDEAVEHYYLEVGE